MEQVLAERLAEETLRIFREICLFGKDATGGYYSSSLIDKLDKGEIITLLSAEGVGDKVFEIPYSRSLKKKHLKERRVSEDLECRWVLKNSSPEKIERSYEGLRDLVYKIKRKGFDSGVLAQYALGDPKIGPLMDKSLALGNPFSILAHWVRHEALTPKYEDWVRRPILIIPGITEATDIRELYNYSIRYQKPSRRNIKELNTPRSSPT